MRTRANPRLGVVAASAAMIVTALLGAPASVRADVGNMSCAAVTVQSGSTTATVAGGSAPTPSKPCWTEVLPYPFGSDGASVTSGSGNTALKVTSFSFRAWNRGLAAMGGTPTGANEVWIFNGSSWYPDASFPGTATCPGTQILWAGKLDYWLVGGGTLCRFDGVNYQWDPLEMPQASLSRAPTVDGTSSAAINTGACFAWNNCWFFGNYGIVDHWDGSTLTDVSLGPGSSPWLQGNYVAAAAGTDLNDNPFPVGLAVTSAATTLGGPALPCEPDGSATPQVFGSSGGAFAPLSLSDPLETACPKRPTGPTPSLVAAAVDANGAGWVAGGATASNNLGPVGPSPLLPVTAGGASCSGYGATDFSSDPGSAKPSYLWTYLSIFPDSGAALASGEYYPANATQSQPMLVTAQCGQPARVVEFPSEAGHLVPGMVVAANAFNDAWAAATAEQSSEVHLYRLSNGQAPAAPAGDDDETRPLVFEIDPPVYVQSPTVTTAPQSATTDDTQTETVTKRTTEKPAVYDVKSGKPIVGSGLRVSLVITFKLRRPVTIGLEGLLHHRVVASSGLHHFRHKQGKLVLILNRNRWPSKLKFITPKAKTSSALIAGPLELTWTARLPA